MRLISILCLMVGLLTSSASAQLSSRLIQPSDVGIITPLTSGNFLIGGASNALKDSLTFGTNGGISLSGGGVPSYGNCFWNDIDTCTTENIRGRERMFLGNAVLMTDNSTSFIGTSWMPSTNAPGYLIRDAQLVSMSDRGVIGLTGASKVSLQNFTNRAAIGVAGYALNDTPGTGTTSNFAWASYFQCDLNPGTSASACYGSELDTVNYGTNQTTDPYNASFPGTYGIWLGAGGGQSPTNPSNAAIAIVQNGTTWNEGIVFRDGGLTKDGSNNSIALSMGQGATLNWYISAGVNGAQVRSTVSTSGQNVTLQFANNQFQFLRAGGGALVNFSHVASGVNGLNLNDAITGSPPFIQPTGGDAVIGLDIKTKSTGVVRLYPGADVAAAFSVQNAALTKTYISVDTSGNNISLPQVTTGTPVASLCIDASNNIIKKTTTGSCI